MAVIMSPEAARAALISEPEMFGTRLAVTRSAVG
jgi:hypothetical protein